MHDSLDPRDDAQRDPAADTRPAQDAEPVTADREVPVPTSERSALRPLVPKPQMTV